MEKTKNFTGWKVVPHFKPFDGEKTQVVTFRIPQETWDSLEIFSIEVGLSMSDIIRLGVSSLLKNSEYPDCFMKNKIGNTYEIRNGHEGVFLGYHSMEEDDGLVNHYDIYKVNKQTCYYLIDNEIAIPYDDFFNQYIVLVNQDTDYD